MYRCAGCGAELFGSDTKFESGTGWPSFTEPAVADAVETRGQLARSCAVPRSRAAAAAGTSATCSTTAPATAGLRYCINSCALEFDAGDSAASTPNPK